MRPAPIHAAAWGGRTAPTGRLVQETVPLQPPAEPGLDAILDRAKLRGGRRRVLDKFECAVLELGVPAVEHEHMKMRVDTQSLGESLDEDDASAMELVAGSGLDAGEDALDNDATESRHRLCAGREEPHHLRGR